MDSDWARNLAERKKSELEVQRLQQEKDLNDRQLLDANADKMWVEVRRAAAGYCKELNHSMASDYIKFEGASYHNSFTLITPETTYTVTFNPQTWLLSAQGTTYNLIVGESNAVAWKSADGKTLSSETVAQNIVGTAFR
ncbi:MAG: hypothetical protein ACRD59_09075 [Candidatus Acidiferrales bacterium]